MAITLIATPFEMVGGMTQITFSFNGYVPEGSTLIKEGVQSTEAGLLIEKIVGLIQGYFLNTSIELQRKGLGVNSRVTVMVPAEKTDLVQGFAATLKVWLSEDSSGGIYFSGDVAMG